MIHKNWLQRWDPGNHVDKYLYKWFRVKYCRAHQRRDSQLPAIQLKMLPTDLHGTGSEEINK